jgi:hypothetical protein
MRWKTVHLGRLQQIEAAHHALEGGTGPGRRSATQQVNDMYLVLLAGHWQEFCRTLHTEAAAFLTSKMPPSAQIAFEAALTQRRWLDRGNPSVENIREDFARFGMDIWGKVLGLDIRNEIEKGSIETTPGLEECHRPSRPAAEGWQCEYRERYEPDVGLGQDVSRCVLPTCCAL